MGKNETITNSIRKNRNTVKGQKHQQGGKIKNARGKYVTFLVELVDRFVKQFFILCFFERFISPCFYLFYAMKYEHFSD
jgi:hypothetical protein